jgi:hypothetical protein
VQQASALVPAAWLQSLAKKCNIFEISRLRVCYSGAFSELDRGQSFEMRALEQTQRMPTKIFYRLRSKIRHSYRREAAESERHGVTGSSMFKRGSRWRAGRFGATGM